MSKYQMNHNLMESILALLNNSADIHSIINQLEPHGQSLPADSVHPLYIGMAYELIKFMDEMPGGFLIYHANDDKKSSMPTKRCFAFFAAILCKNFKH